MGNCRAALIHSDYHLVQSHTVVVIEYLADGCGLGLGKCAEHGIAVGIVLKCFPAAFSCALCQPHDSGGLFIVGVTSLELKGVKVHADNHIGPEVEDCRQIVFYILIRMHQLLAGFIVEIHLVVLEIDD